MLTWTEGNTFIVLLPALASGFKKALAAGVALGRPCVTVVPCMCCTVLGLMGMPIPLVGSLDLLKLLGGWKSPEDGGERIVSGREDRESRLLEERSLLLPWALLPSSLKTGASPKSLLPSFFTF